MIATNFVRGKKLKDYSGRHRSLRAKRSHRYVSLREILRSYDEIWRSHDNPKFGDCHAHGGARNDSN